MTPPRAWAYDGDDPGVCLFTACVAAGAPMSFEPGMRVVEIGCMESDWAERAAATWPGCQFIAIDIRQPERRSPYANLLYRQGNVLDPDLFDPGSVHAVVAISSLEHIGLGHYQDPVDAQGDVRALRHLRHWGAPHGWLYLDVPYQPDRYEVIGTECRVYDRPALNRRLNLFPLLPHLAPQWTGFATSAAAGTLTHVIDKRAAWGAHDQPTARHPRYYYAAMVEQLT